MGANRPSGVAGEARKNLEASAAWRDIEREFFATGLAEGVQRALTQVTDSAVIEAFQSALAAVFEEGAAILAAGSYARRELFPFSGSEIIILRRRAAPPGYREAMAEFVRALWERGIHPRCRSCTLEECLAAPGQDADLAIKLLDRRTLAGDAGLATMLDDKLAASVAKHEQQLGERLVIAARARHARYQNTPFHREPDVKETPGGLQDLWLIDTLANLYPRQASSSDAHARSAAFLSMVRCFLHYLAREDRNLLDASAQEAIVRQFAAGTETRLWMREYFRHARVVFNEARRALELCEAGASPNARSAIGIDAAAVFRVVESVAQHGKPPAPETERELEGAKAAMASFCERPGALWPTLKKILSLPRAAQAIRLLRNTGMLSSILPDWVRVEFVLVDGPDHPYTLDEHTLMLMERICELQTRAQPECERFSELISGADDRAVLLFALLFHHMDKSAGAERAAAALAGAAAARFGAPASDRETVEFLIEHQAVLSEAVSRRDLDHPATVRALAQRIGTIERLRLLTLVTYADITATHSGTMAPLRVEQLWQTYVAAERELTRELETDRIRDVPVTVPGAAEFIRGFPVRYLRTRTAAEIEAHARLYETSRLSAVGVQLDEFGGAYRLTVVAWDRPALFASLAGAISSFGLDIVKAEAFSNARGIILDSFVCTDPRRTLELNPPEAERLQDLVRQIAVGKTEARRLLRKGSGRGAKTYSIQPHVRFDSEACETATLVEIVAEDRPGLLYSLASVFSSSACDIDVVLIDTRGCRAMDVFYVARDGGKLSSELQSRLEQQLLSACRQD